LISISNAEGSQPANAASVVRQAILDFGNANSGIGQDVLYQQFIGVVFAAMHDEYSGKYPLSFVTSKLGFGPTPSFFQTNIPIAINERADYDSADIDVIFY
jgi:hypothetical protein